MRWWISVALACCAQAGPIDFAVAEYKAALASRNLKWKLAYEVTLDPPESYRIEPYKYGGAHITGGDLRGLMYGLLEAAGEIRATGKIKQVHATAATPVRGVRLLARDANFDSGRWRAYFQMLARNRFNRFTLIYTEPPQDLQKLRGITQAASDFAIDFTLALWEHEPDAALDRILAACPLIRAVQVRNTTHEPETYRALVFKPLRSAGRRVALDPDPEFVDAAKQAGIAVRADPPSWPPGFDIDAPPDFEQHALFYFVFGRSAYDPKVKAADSDPAEFATAVRAAMLIVSSDVQGNDWVASIAEAVRNATENIASAKRTPLETVAGLKAEAARLERSARPDFQVIARLARERAGKVQASYDAELGAAPVHVSKPLPRPQISHTPVKTAQPDRPIDVTVQINSKDAVSVRLHYRSLDAAQTSVIEKPAGPSVTFTIPPAFGDVVYYFEILNRDQGGWFEPDPFTSSPYEVIKIEQRLEQK